MEKKQIYISGMITGLPYDEAYKSFEDAETEIRTGTKKIFDIVNPMKLPHLHDKTWESYMKEDLKELLSCDAIYMLKDWYKSKGATIEWEIAKQLGMEVIYQEI